MTITIQRSRKPLSILEKHPRFNFAKLDLADRAGVQELFERHRFPEALLDFVTTLEQKLELEADKITLPMQPGDVECTYADIEETNRDFGFVPATAIDEGLTRFVTWYREFYRD